MLMGNLPIDMVFHPTSPHSRFTTVGTVCVVLVAGALVALYWSMIHARPVPIPFGQVDSGDNLTGTVTNIGHRGSFELLDMNFTDSPSQSMVEDKIYLIHTPSTFDAMPLDMAFGQNANYYGYQYSDAYATAEKQHMQAAAFAQRFPSGKFFASAQARAQDASHGNGLVSFEQTNGIQFRTTDSSANSIRLEPSSMYVIVMNDAHATMNLQPPAVCGDGWKTSSEECDDGAQNGAEASRCTVQCKLKTPVPFTGSGTTNTGAVCGYPWVVVSTGSFIDNGYIRGTVIFQGKIVKAFTDNYSAIRIDSSTDGIHWQGMHTFPYEDKLKFIDGFVVNNGKLWLVINQLEGNSTIGDKKTTIIFSSSDGIQWQEESHIDQFEPNSVVVNGGKLWLIGGMNFSQEPYTIDGQQFFNLEQKVTDAVQYSSDGKTWFSAAKLPRPIYKFSAATLNGRMYIMGGGTYDRSSSDPINPVSSVYSTDGSEWRQEKSLPISLTSPLIIEGPSSILAILEGHAWTFDGSDWADKGIIAPHFLVDMDMFNKNITFNNQKFTIQISQSSNIVNVYSSTGTVVFSLQTDSNTTVASAKIFNKLWLFISSGTSVSSSTINTYVSVDGKVWDKASSLPGYLNRALSLVSKDGVPFVVLDTWNDGVYHELQSDGSWKNLSPNEFMEKGSYVVYDNMDGSSVKLLRNANDLLLFSVIGTYRYSCPTNPL